MHEPTNRPSDPLLAAMRTSEGITQPKAEPSLSAARRHRHIEVLLLCSLALILPYFLGVGPGHLIHIKWWPELPLPETCMSRQLFNIECPGCGLTRSFIHLAHLRWQAAWEVHRLGALMFFAALIQFPYRLPGLLHGRETSIPRAVAKTFGRLLIVALIANWLLGLVFTGTNFAS